MDRDNLATHLGISEERAGKILDTVNLIAITEPHEDVILEKLPELLSEVKTLEEAAFLGYTVAVYADSIAMTRNPKFTANLLIMLGEEIMKLAAIKAAEEALSN